MGRGRHGDTDRAARGVDRLERIRWLGQEHLALPTWDAWTFDGYQFRRHLLSVQVLVAGEWWGVFDGRRHDAIRRRDVQPGA